MDIFKFILENNLILVAVLWVIGFGIGKSKLSNAWIMFILFIISVGLMLLRSWNFEPSNLYEILTQSVLVTGGAVGVNEAPKQFKKLFGNTVSNSSTTP